MKSILEAIKAQLTMPEDYSKAFASSIKKEGDISREAQTKSLHVIKYSEVLKNVVSFNSEIPIEDIKFYFNALSLASPDRSILLVGGSDSYIVVVPSKLKVVPELKPFLLNLLELGHTTVDASEDLQKALLEIQNTNNYNIVSSIMNLAGTLVRKKYERNTGIYKFVQADLNVGHSNISSSISFLLNSYVSNVLTTSSADSIARLFEDPSFISSLKGKINAKVLSYIYNNQLTLIRHFSRGKGHITLGFEGVPIDSIPASLKTQLLSIARNTITEVAPQTAKDNSAAAKIEKQLREYLPIFYAEAAKLVVKRLKSITGPEAVELEGSRSLKQMVKDSLKEDIIESLTGKPTRRKPNTEKTTTSTKKSSSNTTTKKPKAKQVSTAKVISDKPPQLRDLKGHFSSPASIQVLMNQMLHDTIKKNMQRPNLRYQTGRFANSVKVEAISRSRDGALTAFLSYMRYPYATFEVGGKQGHKGYYPSRLINESAREIAAKLTRERFTSVTIK